MEGDQRVDKYKSEKYEIRSRRIVFPISINLYETSQTKILLLTFHQLTIAILPLC